MSGVHKFTSDELIEALRAVVAERPDHVYTVPAAEDDGNGLCLYVHSAGTPDACPGCGVGAALHRLGVPLGQLALYESTCADAVVAQVIGLDRTDPAAQLAYRFQVQQDSGEPWADALATAEEGVFG